MQFKSLKLYSDIFYYNFLTILAYPYELVITVFEPLLEVGFLTLFWSMIAKSSPNYIDLKNIVSYFILVQFIAIWCVNPDGLNFSGYLGSRIKTGGLSQTLIRPIKPLASLIAEHRGMYFVDMIFSVLLFIIAVKLMGGITILQFLWFVIFLFLSFISVFSFSTIVGSIAFSTKEINSIRHSISHLVRLLSGMLVPLPFFPEKLKVALLYTPFPSMVFAPINVLQNKMSFEALLFDFKISFVWSIILFTLAMLTWRYNLRKYEAIGI